MTTDFYFWTNSSFKTRAFVCNCVRVDYASLCFTAKQGYFNLSSVNHTRWWFISGTWTWIHSCFLQCCADYRWNFTSTHELERIKRSLFLQVLARSRAITHDICCKLNRFALTLSIISCFHFISFFSVFIFPVYLFISVLQKYPRTSWPVCALTWVDVWSMTKKFHNNAWLSVRMWRYVHLRLCSVA